MDQTLPDQQSGEPQGVVLRNSNGKKVLLEIILVILLLILVIAVLNYFNIIPLSNMFPNQLGWLPHRSYEQPQQYNNVTIVPTLTPTPSLTEQAKETLVNFLPTVLDPTLLVSSSPGITFIKEEKLEGFTAYWDSKDNGIVKALFIPSVSQNSIDSFNLVFHKTHSQPPSIKVAQDLVPKAFNVTPKGEWHCPKIADNAILFCENFWEEENGTRRGIGLQGYHPQSTSKESTVFFCEHNKEGKDYSWKSCASQFSQTGVK